METHTVATVDYVIAALYVLATAGFGAWFVRRSNTMDGFTLAGKLIPGWAIGMSLLATYLSSISFLANPGKSYASDWRPFVFSLTLPVAILVAVRWFIPLYRNRVKTTAYAYLEQRFGVWARVYMGAAYILLQIGRFAVVLYLMALAIASLLAINIATLILVLGGLTIIYTLVGGFAAVIWTDVVQSVVLVLGGLLCLFLLISHIPGGWEQLSATAERDHKFALGSTDIDFAIQGFWVVFIFGIVENLKNFSVDQNYIQRFLSAPSEAEAKKSLWLGGLLYIPVSALFFMIGTALFVYYLNVPTAGLPEISDQVFPFFIVNELPTGLVGIVIAGVLAAGMSTLDSSLNSSATVWTVDFYKRQINPDANDARQVTVVRTATAVIGIIATVASLLMIDAKSALDVWWKVSAVFGGGMLGLFLCAFIYRGMQPRQAMLATSVGVLFVAWATISSTWFAGASWEFPLHAMMIGVCGTLVVVVTGFLLLGFSGRRNKAV